MAHTVKLIKGTEEIQLYTTDDAAAVYRVRSRNFKITQPAPAVQYHEPSDGPPQYIRAEDSIKTAVMTIDVLGADREASNRSLNILKQWIDGPDSYAALAQADPDSYDKVQLYIQLEDHTAGTYHDAIIGNVNDGAAQYHELQDTDSIYGVIVSMDLHPHGRLAKIHLRNDLASSPHFIEDSNSDGLADGWTQTGSPTLTIDSTYYIIGGKSQKMVTDNSSGQYIETAATAATAGSDLVAYIWIAAPSDTGDPITITLKDGASTTIDTGTFDPEAPAGYDMTTTGAAGATWYRYSLSGSNVAGSAKIRAIRAAADATQITTVYFEMAYLQVDATTIPDPFSSCATVSSQYEPGTSTDRINYLDIWNPPGEKPAILDQILTYSGIAEPHGAAIGRMSEAPGDPTFSPLFFDNGDLTFTAGSGTLSTPTDASRIGGDYERHTSDGAGCTVTVPIPAAVFDKLGSTPYRVIVYGRVSDTGITFQAQASANEYATAIADPIAVNAASTWYVIDCGMILPSRRRFSRDYMTSGTIDLDIYIANTTSTDTADIDAVALIPAAADGFIATRNDHILNSEGAIAKLDISGETYIPEYGRLATIPAGKITRLFYALSTGPASYEHNIARKAEIDLYITPQAKHAGSPQ